MDEVTNRGAVSFLVFSASLRADSLNSRLAALAAEVMIAQGRSDHASMRDFDAPSYDADDETGSGFPPGVEEFRRRLQNSST